MGHAPGDRGDWLLATPSPEQSVPCGRFPPAPDPPNLFITLCRGIVKRDVSCSDRPAAASHRALRARLEAAGPGAMPPPHRLGATRCVCDRDTRAEAPEPLVERHPEARASEVSNLTGRREPPRPYAVHGGHEARSWKDCQTRSSGLPDSVSGRSAHGRAVRRSRPLGMTGRRGDGASPARSPDSAALAAGHGAPGTHRHSHVGASTRPPHPLGEGT